VQSITKSFLSLIQKLMEFVICEQGSGNYLEIVIGILSRYFHFNSCFFLCLGQGHTLYIVTQFFIQQRLKLSIQWRIIHFFLNWFHFKLPGPHLTTSCTTPTIGQSSAGGKFSMPGEILRYFLCFFYPLEKLCRIVGFTRWHIKMVWEICWLVKCSN
jgi:hypothetical protein